MNFRPWIIIYCLVPLFLLVLPKETYSQAFFISVNALDDTDDGQCSTNHCSYREALNLANGFQGQVVIGFSLPNTLENRIEITSELPAITNFGALTVDGSTQFNGAKVIIDGNDRANYGLELESAPNTSVLGLSFENFRTAGVYVSARSINCIIGTENSGNIFEDNRNGVIIQGANADIRNNQFIRNDILGVLVTGSGASATIGSFGNPAADNIFNGQGISGIETDVSADYTSIIRNQFLCNEGQGIDNFNNGNNGVDPPVILSAETTKITGTSDGSALVQVYAFNPSSACFGDNPCQGNTFLGATFADTQGNWELSGEDLEVVPDNSNLVTATQMEFDRFNNTLRYSSEFSACVSLCPIYTLRLEFKSPECLGDTFTIFVLESVTGGDTSEPLDYLWTTPSGLTSSQKDLRTTEVGIFRLLASNSCNNLEDKIEVQVLEALPASIDVSYNGPICEFELLQLFSENIKELEYEWSGPFGWSATTPDPIVNQRASALRSGQYFLNTKGIQFGCPGPKDTVDVLVKRPPEIDSTSFVACINANEKSAIFNLSAKDTILAGPDSSLRVLWFEDSQLQSPITFPSAYLSGGGTVFAIIEDSLACFSDTARIPLILAPSFELELRVLSTPDCADPTGGTIRSLINGGTGPFSFLWFETGETQAGIGNLGPGVYTLQVSDANGCTKIDSVLIPDIPEIEIQCQNIQPVSTVGGSDGIATVNFINSVNLPAKIIYRGPITDSLFASGNGSDTIRNLPAGDYSLEVQSADSCVAFCAFSVSEPDCSNFFLSVSQINPSCGATDDGSIALKVSGLDPIQYVWSDDQFNGLSSISNLGGGLYEVTVTDAAGCSDRASITLIQAEPVLISCLGKPVSKVGAQDGAAEINTSGGTAPYRLSWTGPSNGDQSIPQAGQTLIENLTAGTYSFVLIDAIGCSDTCNLEVLDVDCSNFNLQLNATNSTCADSNDGRIETIIAGGVEPLSFNWSNGSNLPNTQGLSAGSYTLTLSDDLGCTLVETVVIQAPAALVLTCSNPQNTSRVGENDGQISLDISGGTAPYSISIPALGDSTFSSETAAMLTLSNLPAGDYEIFVRDLNDCLTSCSFSIEDPDCSNFFLGFSQINPSCGATDDGSIALQVSGLDPIQYVWSDDQFNGLSSISNLGGGLYEVTVTDAAGCSDRASITLIQAEPVLISCLGNSVSNAGAQDGAAEINASGGTAPYRLSWTGPTNGNQSIPQAGQTLIEDLAAGTYSFVLIDAIGCSNTCRLEILDVDCSNFNLQLSPTNSTCADSNDGRIETITSGGVEPLSFNWSNGSNLPNIQELSAGSYTLTLSDNLGCSLVETVVIQAPPALVLTCSNPRSTSRLGGSDGQISLDISGGNAPYSISIPALGDSTFSSETAAMLTLSNLPAGDYEVFVRDLNDCLTSCSFSIEDPDCSNFSILSDIIQPLCPEEATGTIRISPQNGVGPFIYDWTVDSLDGQSTITGLSPGSYTIAVSDQRGCSVEETFAISATNRVPSVLLGPNTALCFNDCHQLSVEFSGDAPFRLEYQISDGFNSVDFILNSNQADTIIEICANSFAETSSLITLNFTALSDASCSTTLNSNRIINRLNSPRSLLDTLLCTGSFLNINGTTYDQDNPRGIEILTGAASNGCDSLIEIDLRFVDPPEALGIQSTCDINTNQFFVSFQVVGLAPFSIEGISGQFNSNIFTSAPLPANGIYNVTLFDQLGCSSNFEISAPNCSREENCSQLAGSLAPFPSSICELELLNLSTNGDEQLDSNSILLFALHNGTQNTLGEILLSNTDGVFSYQLPLQAGVSYSTAILVGQNNGFGGLDFSDPCLDVFLGPGFQYNFTPDRPLYIQGQDTLCVGETLILSTESYDNPGIQYEWVSPLNDTLITDTNSIQFVNVGPELDGSFSVRVRDGQCVSPFFSPHQFKSIAFPFLFAGEDQTICNINQAALQADPISFGNGIWTSPGQAIIISPTSDSTLVRNLEPGPNIFIWAVSANDCERTDTVIITYTPAPILGDDNLALEPGLTRITFDPFINDQVDGLTLDDSTVQIVNQPESGMVEFLSDDLVFEYTADLSNLEAISFEYTICAPACSTGCDTALVIIKLPDVILEVPDGIIRGRSENGLQIGNLEAFPDNEIIISNRWGVVVHQERNYTNSSPWQGTHNGSDLPQGTYYMYLKIEGKRSIVRKTIHLIVR